MELIGYRIDWSSAGQHVINTSTSDNSITLTDSAADPLYLMGVSGSPAYICANATATTSLALQPIGRDDVPKVITPGTVMHALASSGTGQVFFLRCYPVEKQQ